MNEAHLSGKRNRQLVLDTRRGRISAYVRDTRRGLEQLYEVSNMRTPRKNRTAFRPSLIDIRLEDRVVLNGGAGSCRPGRLVRGGDEFEHAEPSRRDETSYNAYRTQFLNTANGAKQILNYSDRQDLRQWQAIGERPRRPPRPGQRRDRWRDLPAFEPTGTAARRH